MACARTVRLGVIIFLCEVLSHGYAEESTCTPGYESELFVFKVHRDHLHRGKRLGRVTFNNCDGRTRTLFQSVDKRFDVNTDGTVMLQRQVTLHDGHKVFSVHAWDSSGKKHTVSVKVEHIRHHKEHHMDTVMNISPEMELPSDQVLTFPKSSKRAKRGWVIPPFHVPENSRGPFPVKLVQIKSDYAKETQMQYSITGEGANEDPKGIFTVERLSGNLLVTQPLDREKKASYRQWPRYTLLIVAADMEGEGLATTGTAVITVTDSNDNPPQFEQTLHTVSIPENELGAIVAKLTVTDGDEVGSPAWSTKYRIISGDKGGFFSVSTGPSQLEGIITTVKPLDFEKTKQYVLSVVVENDDPFVGSLPTSTATVTVNVEDVNEPPEFNPKEKVIFKPEDSPVDTVLVTYTATDPDTGKSQKMTYKMWADDAGWLSVSPETGVIKVRNLMDRESAYVKDGKYRVIILAVDDATSPATGTGTLVIELENVNDNAPIINESNITICNRGSAPFLLSITDKDGPPFGAPFSVETQGETSKNWSTSMNDTSTGVFLQLKSTLEQGDYNVVLRVYDQHRLYQDSSIQATVCDCTGDQVLCAKNRLGGLPLSGVLGILGAISTLLLLVLLLLFLRRKSSTKKELLLPEDDVRDNIYYYDEEGGGEDDQDYDLSALHRGLDSRPEVFRNDVAPTFLSAPQYRKRPGNPEEIGTFIDDNLKAADNDSNAPPYDSLLVFDYEGGGSDGGSLSSLNSSSSGQDQDYDFLNEWGPRFKKLSDMFGGGED
ncbi:cadherin-1-like isoform X2 [Cyprinus carpio]|uniref:Cadherin-1 n=1 Tax=Cyprinus carpio TaxID=7962 RepID=A0A9Q9YC75_CYPCA|nr:cadherin-1-like isoform X2 [Cyprinus carpio]